MNNLLLATELEEAVKTILAAEDTRFILKRWKPSAVNPLERIGLPG
jgi:hypothetical protein